jgi:hypothetical protein
MPTIKMTFAVLSSLAVTAGLATGWAMIESRSASGEQAEAYQNRYRSYLLADELRQSSDDLTRLGRTYAVTGDLSYKQQYMDILSIRNGEKPRPQAYHRIYWDSSRVETSNRAPTSLTRTVSDCDVAFESDSDVLVKITTHDNGPRRHAGQLNLRRLVLRTSRLRRTPAWASIL